MASKGEFKTTYSCRTESFGAVVNQCAFPVSLMFEVPVDVKDHTFTVQDYFSGTDAENTCSCQAYAYTGNGPRWERYQLYWSKPNARNDGNDGGCGRWFECAVDL